MRSGCPSRRPLVGFTLVELLVVIGIIAVLISLLLPSLSKARRTALKAQCLSNQRQIVMALLMYTDASKGILPGPIEPAVWDPRICTPVPGGPVVGGRTVSVLSTWGALDYSDKMLSSVTLLQKYLGGPDNWKVWQCPAATEMWEHAPVPPGSEYAGRLPGWGYLMNSSSQTSSTTPSFLFGYYGTYTNPTDAQVQSMKPKKLNNIYAVLGPSGATGTSKVSSQIWLLTDIDARNWTTNLSATFGLVTYDNANYSTISARQYQPVHSNVLRPSYLQRGQLGRNYAFLDGHATYLDYYNWPNNGLAEQ